MAVIGELLLCRTCIEIDPSAKFAVRLKMVVIWAEEWTGAANIFT